MTMLGVRIVRIATDNESNMELLKRLLKEQRPDLIYSGCQAHWASLCMKDVVADKGMLATIIDILNYFHNNKAPHAELKLADLPLPPKASETRWGYKLQCVAYYNKWWAQLVTIIAHHLRPNEMVRRNIENV